MRAWCLKLFRLPDEYKTVRQYGPFSAILEASDKTWQLMTLTVSMLGKLITGDVKLNNLSGPISIAQGAGMSAEFGVDLLPDVPCAYQREPRNNQPVPVYPYWTGDICCF